MTDTALHNELCLHKVRGSTTPCRLNFGHGGSHSAHTFCCDGCGRMRRMSQITARHEEAGWFCFLCVTEGNERSQRMMWEEMAQQ